MTVLQLLTTHSDWALVLTLILIAVDAFIGVLKSLGNGTFSWRKLPQFGQTHVLPKLFSLMLVTIVQFAASKGAGWLLNTAMTTVFYGFVVAFNLALLRDILDKFGLKLPANLLGSSELNAIARLLTSHGSGGSTATSAQLAAERTARDVASQRSASPPAAPTTPPTAQPSQKGIQTDQSQPPKGS